MEKVYKVEDSMRGEIEYLSESDLIYGAKIWADRLNVFRREDKDDVDSVDYVVTDIESAIAVYETVNILVM